MAAIVAVAVPTHAETRTIPLEVGDELYAGHDLVKVRYVNEPGHVTATAWVTKLTSKDKLELGIFNRATYPHSYGVVIRLVHGKPRVKLAAAASSYPYPVGPVTCRPPAVWDTERSLVSVRIPDRCLPDLDLSRLRMWTDLGVKGKNFLSDMSGIYLVRRG